MADDKEKFVARHIDTHIPNNRDYISNVCIECNLSDFNNYAAIKEVMNKSFQKSSKNHQKLAEEFGATNYFVYVLE
jgi:hypothetical protein